MPLQQVPQAGLEYHLICYDKQGREHPEDGKYLSDHVADIVRDVGRGITDVFVMSHGWKGDVPAAIDQYDRWSTAMAACNRDRERVQERWSSFTPLLIGFHWPSLPWGDEKMADGSYAAEPVGGEDEFVRRWGDRIADSDAARSALSLLFRAAQEDIEPDVLPAKVVDAYRTLEREADLNADGVSGAPDGDRETMDPQRSYEDWRDTDEALSYAGGLMGGLLSPLRQLSFWTMKKRALLVGETGGHKLLRQLLGARDGLRIHLMGHSFGCIVSSSMLRGAAGEGAVVSSMFLVQGAMSLWSYAKQLPGKPGAAGYFRRVVEPPCVRGAIVVTTSKFDRAVGMLYPKAAGLIRQVDYGAAPRVQQLPIYGAIGTFGLQGVGLHASYLQIGIDLVHDYKLVSGGLYNLNADAVIKTGGGLSGAHSDIAHSELGHVFWEAVLATPD
jgi:hypothetical protein